MTALRQKRLFHNRPLREQAVAVLSAPTMEFTRSAFAPTERRRVDVQLERQDLRHGPLRSPTALAGSAANRPDGVGPQGNAGSIQPLPIIPSLAVGLNQ